ncbi:hypothetical protein [Nonomuraea sp. 10N515B]|uniref:hypothetical protein n=1 Tax=Nonomuraea sp. 10N515B TaxID=3457422 RepID=UPI003FCD5BAA
MAELISTHRLKGTDETRTVIADRLFRFYDGCAASRRPELKGLATTIETWWPEITTLIQTRLSDTRPRICRS